MDESYDNGEELCCFDSVLLKKANANHITELENPGTLSLVRYLNNVYTIEWKPNESFLIADSDTQEQDDWSFVDKIARRNRTESETLIFNTSTNSITTARDTLGGGTGTISSSSSSGASGKSDDVPDHSHNSIEKSSSVSSIQKSKIVRANLNTIKSIDLLTNNNEIRLVGLVVEQKCHSQFFFQQRNAEQFLRTLESYNLIRSNARNRRVFDIIRDNEMRESTRKTFDALDINVIKRTKGSGGGVLNDFFIKFAEILPPAHVMPTVLSPDSHDPIQTHSGGEEYEVLDETSTTDVNPFEGQIKELEDKLSPRRHIARSTCLTEKVWRELQSEDGRISDVEKIKEMIFRGGVENSLRSEVWKYLLEYDPWEMTHEQRTIHRRKKTDEYFQMKLQWKSMTKVQEENFCGYRDRKCQIEKDVKRTDRTEEFFAGDHNPNLDLLQDILMTYVMYNFDLGYVQGMSDLLAPILCVMQNEQDTFWCFVGFMKRVFSNFDIDQAGMKQQLHQLARLISFACPRLYYYLKETSSDNMYFCFRWLLVWFKREFCHADVMRLWEVMWTGLPCPNFQLLVCVAILELQMATFIDNKYEFTDILKHINDLSLKIDLKQCLENAEAIYQQIKESKHLTDELRVIIGEDPVERSDHSDSEDEVDGLGRVQTSQPRQLTNRALSSDRKLDELCELSMNYSFL